MDRAQRGQADDEGREGECAAQGDAEHAHEAPRTRPGAARDPIDEERGEGGEEDATGLPDRDDEPAQGQVEEDRGRTPPGAREGESQELRGDGECGGSDDVAGVAFGLHSRQVSDGPHGDGRPGKVTAVADLR